MASILNVDQINNAAGTSAVTIDPSTGKPSFPNGVTLPAGSFVQIKHAISDAEFTSSSTSFVNSGLFTLTFDNPIQSGSKVYAQISATIGELFNNSWAAPVFLTLYQGTISSYGSNIGDSVRGIVGGNAIANASGTVQNEYDMDRLHGTVYHTPSNTNPHYYLFMRSHAAFARYIGSAANAGSTYDVGRTSITLMEIAG
jgi:hypothetical protein